LIGPELMTFALHPDKGALIVPTCAVKAEQDGVYNMFKGAIEFFKNPSSHRMVENEKRIEAIKIVVYADLLLEVLSNAVPRT
jgi:Protein of unknown function (Hypoth_ymh)